MATSDSSSRPSAAGNRLSIAHLLLWTAATALVLAYLRQTSGDATEVGQLPPQVVIGLWLQTLLSYAIAPAYGAAVAGLGLAAWQLVTRRFGFPVQPGHWVLLAISVGPFFTGAGWVLRLQETSTVFLTVTAALASLAALTTLATLRLGQPTRWLVAFGLAAGGSAAAVVAALLQLGMGGELVPPAAIPGVLGGLAIAAGAMAGLVAGILDLTAPDQYDFLHWTGVGTLFAVVAHPLAAWFILAGMLP